LANYAPGVKIDPAPGSQYYIELNKANFKRLLLLGGLKSEKILSKCTRLIALICGMYYSLGTKAKLEINNI